MVATATTAVLSAAGLGVAFTTEAREQSSDWSTGSTVEWAFGPEQKIRMLTSSGGQIGVSIRDLGEEDAKSGKGPATGVLIEEVETDSPAQKAGFRVNDVIVEFDGERVRSTRQFIRLVQETPAGRQIQAAVLRDGQRVTLSVQPRQGGLFHYLDSGRMLSIPTPKPPAVALKGDLFRFGSSGRLGISVDDLSPQLAEYFGTKQGVLVTAVTDNSSASKAGVKAGDVITAFNGETVSTSADLRRQAQRLESSGDYTLAVVRDKKALTLKGKLEPLQPRRSPSP
jgi:serine protease Do